MNSITIAGILGRDAEMRYLPNGDPVCSFSVADSMGRDKHTIWWRCSLFGKRAEALNQYLLKGTSVTVSGNVTEREYDKDGVKMKAMDVRVSDVALQGTRSAPSTDTPKASKPAATAKSGFEDMDDDIPFANPMKSRAFCLSV